MQETQAPVEAGGSPRFKSWLLALGLVVAGAVVGAVGVWVWGNFQPQVEPKNFEECLAAEGSVIHPSYPGVCVTKAGQRFAQPLEDEAEGWELVPPIVGPTATTGTIDENQEVEFVCPEQKQLHCFPDCPGGRCPMFFPMYCSKGSAYYNFIIENCPEVEIIGAS